MKMINNKLNVLLTLTVITVGLLAGILVYWGGVRPGDGAGAGIRGIKKAEKYHKKNTVKVELDTVALNKMWEDEEVLNLLNDPEFQKFMKSSEFQKFRRSAMRSNLPNQVKIDVGSEAFIAMMRRGGYQKFMKNGAFQKFMKEENFNKFMKSNQFQKFMKGADFQKFQKQSN